VSILRKLWQFANGDLLGREEVVESEHPYFGKVVYFGRKGEGGYWEAEFLSEPKAFSVIIPAQKAEPLDPYVELCQTLTNAPEKLFAACRPAFEAEFTKWSKAPFPRDWKEGFVLDGITLPDQADRNREWSVCYFVPAARRYFTAQFKSGAVAGVTVDG
jgi:hypothetical protein